jgi:hypothetical protein
MPAIFPCFVVQNSSALTPLAFVYGAGDEVDNNRAGSVQCPEAARGVEPVYEVMQLLRIWVFGHAPLSAQNQEPSYPEKPVQCDACAGGSRRPAEQLVGYTFCLGKVI